LELSKLSLPLRKSNNKTMKETFKIFKLRDKMKDPPPVPLFTKFFNGESCLTEKNIAELQRVLDREHKLATLFLNNQLKKLQK
jgi:hypothetical protein